MPTRDPKNRHLPAIVVLLISMLAMGLVWRAMSARIEQDQFDRFDFETQLISARISERMAGNVLMLRGAAGLFSADHTISRSAWQRYIWELNLDQSPRGVQIVAYAKSVPADKLAEYMRDVRHEGYEDFLVHPQGKRSEYSSVHFLEPFSGQNLQLFGFDLLSDPNRKAAMLAARDTGRPAFSGKLRLLQERAESTQAEVMVCYPVYAGKILPKTIEERRAALQGWVYMAFQMHDMMDALLSHQSPEVRLEIFDSNTPSPDALLFDSLAARHGQQLRHVDSLVKVSQLQLEDRVWTLRYTALPDFAASTRFDAPWLMIGAMVLISVLLFALTWAFMNTRYQAQIMASGLTSSLRQSEERYRSIFSRSRVAALLIDPESRLIVEANQAAVSYYGYPDIDFRDMPLANLVVLDDMSLIIELENFRVERQTHVFGHHRLKNGEVRDVEVHAGPIELNDRKLVFAIVHDITERRKAETAVADLNRRYQGLLEAASEVAIIATDADGLITVFNRGAERMLGYTAGEMVGRVSPAAFHDPQEIQARSRELSAMLGREVFGFRVFTELPILNGSEQRDWSYVRKDGSRVQVSLTVTPVKGANGVILGFLGIALDITQLKSTEASLMQAKEAAEQASYAKGAFLANMSHEIRTPMNGVIGMAQLLQHSDLSDEQSEFVEIIKSSADALLAIINDILDFSKVEAGKLLIEDEPFELQSVVNEVVRMFIPQTQARELRLEVSVDENVPSWISGDAIRLRQILTNLLGNAVKFTSSGGIFVEVSYVEGNSRQVTLAISVRDTGIGMSSEILSGLFSPFYQGDSSVTRRFGGTGLGLSITHGLVELMGGKILVQSTEGLGATFSVRLPFGVAHAVIDETVSLVSDDLPTAANILVVDDTATNQQVAVQMLRKLKMNATVASNGEEAIRLLTKGNFALVLMDCQMPVMDGFTATSKIRVGAAGRDKNGIPIVAMTANAVSGDRERCLAAGMDDYLAKPIALEALKTMLSRWLSLHPSKPNKQSRKNTAPSRLAQSREMPVFAKDELLVNCGGDEDLVAVLIEAALLDIPKHLAILSEAYKREAWDEVQTAAHTLKGLAAQLSGKRMAEAAKEVELTIRGGRQPSRVEIDAVAHQYSYLKEVLEKLKQS